MIKSMTGFGRYEFSDDKSNVIVEMKSVNHRYCDVYAKLPRNLQYFEDKVKKYITGAISRGKVDVFISFENTCNDSKEVIMDEAVIEAYYQSLKKISDKYGLMEEITPYMLARFPDALRIEKSEIDDEYIWKMMEDALKKALEILVDMRLMEGEKLKKDILDKAATMVSFITEIAKRSHLVVEDYKAKLESRIKELIGQNQVDEVRLATEVAIYADKCSIDEELVRLNSHISQLKKILDAHEPVGRKLDFLIQEMNREVNTIGSKANDLTITQNVVELKSEIEKIREQVQNIE